MRLASIKSRITAITIVLVGIAWLVAAQLTWMEARHEAEELLDAHLVQTASLLLAQAGGAGGLGEPAAVDEEHAPQLHRYARRVAFQVWANGQLRLHSANAPATPLSSRQEGFSTQSVGDHAWRVFSATDPAGGLMVQVGERSARRDKLARGFAAGLLWPLLLTLPLLAVLLWLAVRHGMRPLLRVAGELGERSPDRLERLSEDELPAEVAPLVARLNSLLERVERSLENERRFTADAAHELRTPLAALRAQAQVALGASDDSARRHALEQLLSGCDRMSRLVAQLLTLARADAVQATAFTPLELDALLRQAVGEAADGALAKGQEIGLDTSSLDTDGPATMHGNPAWLAILLRNLLDNAVRYTPRGGSVQVALRADGPDWLLTVEDSGPGVPADELQRLGQRFWRRLESAGEEGSGLGLSIAARIVERHHGSLCFGLRGSPPGHGLRVELRLPRSRPACVSPAFQPIAARTPRT